MPYWARKLRKKQGLRCKQKRKFRETTDSRHELPVAPNLLNREFEIAAPNKAWISDITCIPTIEGWLIHHSDRGSQHFSRDYQKLLCQFGMVASMSRKRDCWDNAPMKSFCGALKNELAHHCKFETRQQAKQEIRKYIVVFYNRSRKQKGLGYLSPAKFTQRYYATQPLLNPLGSMIDSRGHILLVLPGYDNL